MHDPESPSLVYVDTSFLSRITDSLIHKGEGAAWQALAGAKQEGKLRFVVSSRVSEELQQTPNEERRGVLSFLYVLFGEVNSVSTKGIMFMPGMPAISPGLGFPAFYDQPEYKMLKQIFDAPDAGHVYQATKAGCRYFLTRDRKTILSRIAGHRDKLAKICPHLEFVSPIELAEALGDTRTGGDD